MFSSHLKQLERERERERESESERVRLEWLCSPSWLWLCRVDSGSSARWVMAVMELWSGRGDHMVSVGLMPPGGRCF